MINQWSIQRQFVCFSPVQWRRFTTDILKCLSIVCPISSSCWQLVLLSLRLQLPKLQQPESLKWMTLQTRFLFDFPLAVQIIDAPLNWRTTRLFFIFSLFPFYSNVQKGKKKITIKKEEVAGRCLFVCLCVDGEEKEKKREKVLHQQVYRRRRRGIQSS